MLLIVQGVSPQLVSSISMPSCPCSVSRAIRAAITSPYRRILTPLRILRPQACRFLTIASSPQTSKNLTQPPAKNSIVSDAVWFDPSRPTTDRGDPFNNAANLIEEQLLEDGHRLWGLAIYRCTYGDDAAWETCLERLNASIRESMFFYKGLDLLEEGRFRLTIFDDASRFDGAGIQLVRQHFKEWRKHAMREEQGTIEETEARRKKPKPLYHPYGTVGINLDVWARSMGKTREEVEKEDQEMLQRRKEAPPDIRRPGSGHGYGYFVASVRYRFCVQIDEAAMRSIISPEGESVVGEAWLNLVEVDWEWSPEAAAAQRDQERIEHLAMDLDPEFFDDEEEVFPEIDGCTAENVGWMRVHYQALIPEFCAQLRDHSALNEYLYWRPPGIGGRLT